MPTHAARKMPADTLESSRRSSAQKARDQNERAGQIVAFATDAIISKDRAGLITSWNLGAERELEELSWIGRLRDAMDEDRLVLAGQPIVSLDSGEVVGQELLVRLHRDARTSSRTGDRLRPGLLPRTPEGAHRKLA
jgi:sensor c-di-GMP phosphodiesterase-like protein